MAGSKEKPGCGQKWGRAAAVRSSYPAVADSGVATLGPIFGRAQASPSLAPNRSFSGAAQNRFEPALRIPRELERVQRVVEITELRGFFGL